MIKLLLKSSAFRLHLPSFSNSKSKNCLEKKKKIKKIEIVELRESTNAHVTKFLLFFFFFLVSQTYIHTFFATLSKLRLHQKLNLKLLTN